MIRAIVIGMVFDAIASYFAMLAASSALAQYGIAGPGYWHVLWTVVPLSAAVVFAYIGYKAVEAS